MQKLSLILLFLLMALVPMAPALAAQPTYASPYGYVHDLPYFATNLTPGGTVEVGIWLERLDYEPESTIRYVGELGATLVDISNTDSGYSYNLLTELISADVLMKHCSGGLLEVNERILQKDVNGDYSILLSEHSEFVPCAWAGTDVPSGPVVPPTVVFVCGPNNDRVTLATQPRHVHLISDSGWIRGGRVLQYGTDPGFALAGPSEFRLYDNPILLCPSPIITPPPIINTPTPRPTLIPIRPTPRGFPLPIVTLVPYPTVDPHVTPTTDLRPPTPTPRLVLPYPIMPTPRGFPLPFPTFAVDTNIPAQAQAAASQPVSDGSHGREVAVLSLAPVAVILGVIAAHRRRDE